MSQQPQPKRVPLIDVSRAIRATNGQIWSISKPEDGASVLFRATVGGRQIRVLSVLAGYTVPDVGTDRGLHSTSLVTTKLYKGFSTNSGQRTTKATCCHSAQPLPANEAPNPIL